MKTLGKTMTDSTSTAQPGCRQYYPKRAKFVNADGEGFKRLAGRLTKNQILAFLKDTIG